MAGLDEIPRQVALHDLDALIADLQTRMEEVQREKMRKLAQVDELLEQARTHAAEEIGKVECERLRKVEEREVLHRLAVAEFERQLADLDAAKELEDQRRTQRIAEAKAKYELDMTQLATQLQEIADASVLEIAEIDRKIGDLLTNKEFHIAEVET